MGTYRYSTFGFMLAGAAIDKAGRDAGWGDYETMALALADSLNMTSFEMDRRNNVPSLQTDGFYVRQTGSIENIENEEDVIYKVPGGGFRSNIKDIARFCRAMINQDVLTDTLWNIMNRQRFSNTSTGYGYGLGTEHFNTGRNNHYFGHGGVQDESRTHMYYYPNHRTGIIFLCSSHHLNRWRMKDVIAQSLGLPITPANYNLQSDLGCNQGTPNNSVLFASSWEKGTEAQLFRRGLTQDAFNQQYNELSAVGYRLVDIETWVDDKNVRRWDGVFTESSESGALWRNFTQAGFKTKWDEMTAQGLHLIDLETYVSNGTRLWAGAFV
ncbi:MAG: serine hydrolase, partial [Bacteroidota bacterium]